jgi:oxygen-independent coproporphyrinogen-3 oxidase
MDPEFTFSEALRSMYLRYSRLYLPRYTSYPAIPYWSGQATQAESRFYIDEVLRQEKQVSLYFHVPFCQKLCFYCGCQKEIMSPRSAGGQRIVQSYLDGLVREAQVYAHHFDGAKVEQIHFGGGTPNFLDVDQWRFLYEQVLSRFNLSPDLEWSVEIDPRTVTEEVLRYLRDIGVSRLSLGVQDFDPKVQKAINRIQPFATVSQIVEMSRAIGIRHINFDLIYGLPFQTQASMDETLSQVMRLRPDRVAYYRLALLPQLFSAQRAFVDKDLPTGEASLDLNLLAIRRFMAAGYRMIGLDHFALDTDPLAIAAREGRMQRNFQGMTTGRNLPLFGLGPSAISSYGRFFVQNPKSTSEWLTLLADHNAQRKAHVLTHDDTLRKAMIDQIFCQGRIAIHEIEERFGVRLRECMTRQWTYLTRLADDGLVRLEPDAIELTQPLGQLLRRVVASVFDAYIPEDACLQGLGQDRGSQVG